MLCVHGHTSQSRINRCPDMSLNHKDNIYSYLYDLLGLTTYQNMSLIVMFVYISRRISGVWALAER